jgi:hypothetical protein
MRSPRSSSLRITNCPGLALVATAAAVTLNRCMPRASFRRLKIRYNSSSLDLDIWLRRFAFAVGTAPVF